MFTQVRETGAGIQFGTNPNQGVGFHGAGPTPQRAGSVQAAVPQLTAASGVLTFSEKPSNGDTVTIGATTYTFKTTLTGAANEVLIGANAGAAIANLCSAIGAGAGAGSTYGTGTVANASVTAAASGTGVALTAITPGSAGNAIATTSTGTIASFGAATLAGGTDLTASSGTLTFTGNPLNGETVTIGAVTYVFRAVLIDSPTVENEVVIAGTLAETIDNLCAAIGSGSGAGTAYSGTAPANLAVSAVAGSTTVTLTAATAGSAGNAISTTETSTMASFGAATLTGGTDLAAAAGALTLAGNVANNDTVTVGATTYTFKTALSTGPTVANQVLIGANLAASIANLCIAVNGGSGIGTDYSTGTAANASATAAGAGTTVTVTAMTAGTGGNAVATTTTSAVASFGATTLLGGVNAATIAQLTALVNELQAALVQKGLIKGSA
jgi:hypothetical protein